MNVITIDEARDQYGVTVRLDAAEFSTVPALAEMHGVTPESFGAMLTPTARARLKRISSFPHQVFRGWYPTAHARAWKILDNGGEIVPFGMPHAGTTPSPTELLRDHGLIVTIRPADIVSPPDLADLLRIGRSSISAQLINARREGWRGRAGVGPTPWKLMGLPAEIVPSIRDRRDVYRWLLVKEGFQRPSDWADFTPETYALWESERYAELLAEGASLIPLAVTFPDYGREVSA